MLTLASYKYSSKQYIKGILQCWLIVEHSCVPLFAHCGPLSTELEPWGAWSSLIIKFTTTVDRFKPQAALGHPGQSTVHILT